MSKDLARRNPDVVHVTPDDVMTGADRAFVREAIGSANAKLRAALDAWDETFFYGYVGGRADDEAARAQAKRRASDRIISRAIDGAAS